MGEQPGFLHRIFGGAPHAVVVRLLVVSVLIGAIMAGVGLTPENVVAQAEDAARYVWFYGMDGVRHVGAYALMGALIVIPVWLLTRLAGRN